MSTLRNVNGDPVLNHLSMGHEAWHFWLWFTFNNSIYLWRILPRTFIHHIHSRRFMSWQRIILHIWTNITEREHSRTDQSLNFILQSPTVFQIMPRSVLMISTSGISFVPPREFLWHRG